ncbi:GNAT family N-acetyltransferase [Aurantimonas sp. A2-1-M11]|uniref:GNAT family N-acetyltransferase n=1 Tax=Aurantimonas sp. A2-1-M11 TaxID=3113712 RepID=UPI002F9566FC
MSAIVRPAQEGDIGAVIDLLHRHMNAKIPPERWRRLLDYPWRPDGVERGWLVEDHGRIVGFMGTIYSDRRIGGQVRRFCDLSSWYLLADYRGDGTGDELLRSGMAQPGVTYQTMTARRATGRRIRALGFSILDDSRSLFRPGSPGAGRLSVLREASAIRARLDAAQRAVFDAHAGFDLHQAIVGDTWIVWQRKLKGDSIAYHEILHASDPAFLSAEAQTIADVLVTGERGVLAIDTRFMTPGDDPGTIEAIVLPRWFRSPHVAARDVDHLHSEIILLDQKLP